MFTGIIETVGTVAHHRTEGTNVTFEITTPLAAELHVDQSVAHDGVCLTVTDVQTDRYAVTAVEETLRKTTLGDWQSGRRINLERCMPAHGRFDGHIVQGHVDTVGTCTHREDRDGSWLFDFAYAPEAGHLVVEKGSICINGVSLTVFDVTDRTFRVTIIPYTFEHTSFADLHAGQRVNLEFDIVGKYVQRMLSQTMSA